MTTWTHDPPKEPGWYWYNSRRTYRDWYVRPVLLYNRYGRLSPGRLWINGTAIEVGPQRDGCLWWPIPIQPPPTELDEIEKALEEEQP